MNDQTDLTATWFPGFSPTRPYEWEREPGNEVDLRDGATSSQGLLAFQYGGSGRAAILESEKTLGTRLGTESWIFGILSVP